MHATAIVPFGFMREPLEAAARRHALCIAGTLGDGVHVVAIGSPGAYGDDATERLVEELLPHLDAVVLFDGFEFDRAARQRSRHVLAAMLDAHGVPMLALEEDAVAQSCGGRWREMMMSEAIRRIADALIARVPS